MRTAAVLLLCALALLASCEATVYNLTPASNWKAQLGSLQAGDTAILAAGEYVLSGFFELTLNGQAGAPIVVKGEDKSTVIIRQSANQNVMNVIGSYYNIYNITFTGGSRGVRLGPAPSAYATFQDLIIHDTKETGFSANDAGATHSHLTIRGVEIYNTGNGTSECFYFGCQDDKCRVHDSLIELNYCHDTMSARSGYGSGIQLKTGSFRNVIRNNVLRNTRGPGILLYDDFKRGMNLVEGNYIHTTGDAGIQLTSGAVVRNNIVVGAANYGIFVANNQNMVSGVYHDIQILQNTVYSSTRNDLYLPALSGSGFVIANNLFLSSSAFSVSTQTGTVWLNNAYVAGSVPSGVTASTGLVQVAASVVVNAAANNFYPATGSALIDGGSGDYTTVETWDFNGTPRSSTPTIGAYERTSVTNPGWTLDSDFKTVLPSYPANSYNLPGDGGSASTLTSWLSLLM